MVVSDIDADGGAAVVSEIEGEGGTATFVVFLCSEGASFMTGSQVVVDGGAPSHG